MNKAEAAAVTPHARGVRLPALTIAATGIVFGDIGTSPLYAVDQIFFGHGGAAPGSADVLGGISLVIWTLTLIVAVKYAILVLRAHNDGEGGVFALYGLLHESRRRGMGFFLWSLVLGAGLLFGDGIITPAISVLSAVEGLGVATPALARAAVPVTLALLTALFAFQSRGTAGIGRIFGPVLLGWFLMIAVLGAVHIVGQPRILAAFNPLHGLRFLHGVGFVDALFVLGALMLVVTGGEALYADLGHFGSRPIRVAWFAIVYPALLLNYLGQGAYLLSGAPVAGGKLFFSMVPAALLYPVVLLATVATVIASQALISGAFSLASQATRLGLLPRLEIRHTHQAHAGQIYVPAINWALYAGCIVLVVGFGSSAGLAAAYGLAVSGVMLITSLTMFPIARQYWNWNRWITGLVWGGLSAVNAGFLLATSVKFLEGGFIPLTLGLVVFAVMATWRWGRKATFAAYAAKPTMTVAELVGLHRDSRVYLERTALLMVPKPVRSVSDNTPALLQLLWDRYGVLPRDLIFVEVVHRKIPYLHDGRIRVTVLDSDRDRGSIISVELSFGFMEEPDVERALEGLARHRQIALDADRRNWIVHLSQENLLPSRSMGLPGRLRFRLFLVLRRLSRPAYTYYGLGDHLQLSSEIMPVRVR
jgi:KUP system potassium uptake protein